MWLPNLDLDSGVDSVLSMCVPKAFVCGVGVLGGCGVCVQVCVVIVLVGCVLCNVIGSVAVSILLSGRI